MAQSAMLSLEMSHSSHILIRLCSLSVYDLTRDLSQNFCSLRIYLCFENHALTILTNLVPFTGGKLTDEKQTAIIIGASGLVGKSCLALLLASGRYAQVIAVTRRPLDVSDKRFRNLVVDFDNLERSADQLRADDIYCTLGTTIRHAGSKEAFRKVDFSYPLRFAELAVHNGARQFILISSVGASSSSSAYYLRVKGELEDALAKLPFQSQHFLRPAMLDGHREDKRLREEVGVIFSHAIQFLLVGRWRKYRAIKVTDVARAMLIVADRGLSGVHIYESNEIQKLATSSQ